MRSRSVVRELEQVVGRRAEQVLAEDLGGRRPRRSRPAKCCASDALALAPVHRGAVGRDRHDHVVRARSRSASRS